MPERLYDRWVISALVLYSLCVVGALLLAGVSLGRAVAPWRWPGEQPALLLNSVSLTYDDGFYYFKIAQHLASGAGSTFDGVHPTNGYHPLWLLCLVPIFWLRATPDTALILGVMLQGLLMTAGVALTYQSARLMFGRFAASLAVLLWIYIQLIYRVALSGMEYSLQAVGILATAYVYMRWFAERPAPRLRWYLALGLLLSLTFLARLDTILLAGCVIFVLAWRELRDGMTRASAVRLLALAMPVAGTGLAYAGVNLWLFESPLPVSGIIKGDWSARLLAQDPHYQAQGWFVAKLYYLLWPFGHMSLAYALFLAAGTIGAAVGLLLGAKLRRPWSGRALRAWWPFALFGVLQLLLFVFLYHGGFSFQPWYYVVQPWLGAMLAAAFADAIWRWARQPAPQFVWARRLALLMLIAGLCGAPLATVRTIRQWQSSGLNFTHDPIYAAAVWAGANVPAGAIIGSWNAGMISYLSGREVVNLDGLVNSWDFYRVKQHDLCDYWRETRITYLVDVFEAGRELAFIKDYYAPSTDLTACAAQLDRIWVGPAYPNSARHAEAYHVRQAGE
jgi:hypothetical protein